MNSNENAHAGESVSPTAEKFVTAFAEGESSNTAAILNDLDSQGLTRKDIANQLGVHPSSVSRLAQKSGLPSKKGEGATIAWSNRNPISAAREALKKEKNK